MSDYINRDEAIEAIAYRLAINKDDYERAERQAVDWLPEAEEDVVKVVRCKDCKNRTYDRSRDLYYCCLYYGLGSVRDNNYCSLGERLEA